MEIHQLEYLLAVAEARSFSQAALNVRVAQPSLSQQIKKLEAEVGQPLFDRLSRGVVLTEAGRLLTERARKVLSELSDAKREVSDAGGQVSGTLAIGAIPTIAPYVLPRVVMAYSKRWPDVRVRIVEDTTQRLSEELERGGLDVGIMSDLQAAHTIHVEEVATEPLLAMLPANHPLAKKKRIAWESLAGEKFLALNEMHCLSGQVMQFCKANRLEPMLSMRGAQLVTLAELTAAGAGVSVVPRMMARVDRSTKRVFRAFESPEPTRSLCIATCLLRYRSRAMRAFIDLLRPVLKNGG
jgi:LysR family hydrogen peroxide-inducible transcriptional activator